MNVVALLAIFTVASLACQACADPLKLASPAFDDHGSIPVKYTCEGDDISPPLTWRGVPAEARSLALIVDDPDAPDPAAPKVTWIHWVVFDIPADAQGLPEDVDAKSLMSGLNSWERTGYGGPCPPIGRHRYFFKLYALDRRLEFADAPTNQALEAAMRGHIVGNAVLIGTYQKSN